MYLCRSGHIWNLWFNSIFGEITCGLLSCFCFEQRGKVVFAFTENNFLSWKKQLLLANSNRVLDVKLLRRSRHAFLTVANRSIIQSCVSLFGVYSITTLSNVLARTQYWTNVFQRARLFKDNRNNTLLNDFRWIEFELNTRSKEKKILLSFAFRRDSTVRNISRPLLLKIAKNLGNLLVFCRKILLVLSSAAGSQNQGTESISEVATDRLLFDSA